MRVALIQLPAREVEACTKGMLPAQRIEQLLDLAGTHNADLAVFPESYPFIANSDKVKPPPFDSAIADLQTLPPHPVAFIVGGYVMEGDRKRNASFLVHQGRVHTPYFKRVPWQDEDFDPGKELLRWSWNDHQVIPLICADVCVPWNEPDGRTAQMMGEAATLGAGPGCPIIVSTFGADLRAPYWTDPLRAWARACNAPVLVSAVAGKSAAFFVEGKKNRHYGGGGSGMYWFEDGQDHVWPPDTESRAARMFLVDTLEPEACWVALKRHAESQC